MITRYKASRGGHAPGYLRDAFSEALDLKIWEYPGKWYEKLDEESIFFYESVMQKRWESLSCWERGIWLIGQLWNCTDYMPSALCYTLDVPPGSTYAIGVRNLRKVMN
jgi:hypothetical protein